MPHGWKMLHLLVDINDKKLVTAWLAVSSVHMSKRIFGSRLTNKWKNRMSLLNQIGCVNNTHPILIILLHYFSQ